jgi:predicted acetyltransferase
VPIQVSFGPPDAVRLALETVDQAFGDLPGEEDFARESKLMPTDRILTAFDGDYAVGSAASYPFRLTIPGGDLPAAGVTWVGVLPSHRRRGVMTAMMRSQIEDVHKRGEPLAILWASEAAIYGRFGYGIAAPVQSLEAERARFRLRDDPGPAGSVRLIDSDEAARLFPPIYEAVRASTPGTLSRTKKWWTENKLADPEGWRRGAGPKFFAVVETDGAPTAYATYRIKHEWEHGIPRNQVRVVEAFATSPGAARDLWRFLFGIDLVAKVVMYGFDPGSPLFVMVSDPRSLQLKIMDGLWLRLVDVEAALRARSYADGDPVVIDVRDELCRWNRGRYLVGEKVTRTRQAADLELDVADLAAAYLGGFDFNQLAAAERARELTTGALERASLLFRTPRPPYCPEVF